MKWNEKQMEAQKRGRQKLGSVLIDNKKIIIDGNSYKTREKIYNSKTNIWTDTRPLYYDNLTRSITVYIPKDIIKEAKPLLFENLTRSIVVYTPKYIIKYSSTSYPNPDPELKVPFEGYAYADKKKFNNINNTVTITSFLNLALKCFPRNDWVLRCLRWMGGKYSATVLSIRSGYVLLRGEEMSNSIYTIYIIIFFLVGIGLCLYFPSLLYSVTGIDIYNNSSLTDSGYSTALFAVRNICANIFFYLLFYFGLFIIYKLKLSIPRNNNWMMGAACIVIKGGFEGLGGPEWDEQNKTQKPEVESYIEQIRTTPQSSHKEWIARALLRIQTENDAARGARNPDLAEVVEGNYVKPVTVRSTTSGYPDWPIQNTAKNIPTLPETDSEPVPTNKDNNKKVRINGYTEVIERAEVGIERISDDIIDTAPKNRVKRINDDFIDIDTAHINKLLNANDNIDKDRRDKQHAVWNWSKNYPWVNEKNRPELEIVFTKEELKYKSSSTVTEPKLENIDGHITNPASKTDVLSHIKDLNGTFK